MARMARNPSHHGRQYSNAPVTTWMIWGCPHDLEQPNVTIDGWLMGDIDHPQMEGLSLALPMFTTGLPHFSTKNLRSRLNHRLSKRPSYFTRDLSSWPRRWKLSCGLFRHLTGIQAVGKDLRRSVKMIWLMAPDGSRILRWFLEASILGHHIKWDSRLICSVICFHNFPYVFLFALKVWEVNLNQSLPILWLFCYCENVPACLIHSYVEVQTKVFNIWWKNVENNKSHKSYT